MGLTSAVGASGTRHFGGETWPYVGVYGPVGQRGKAQWCMHALCGGAPALHPKWGLWNAHHPQGPHGEAQPGWGLPGDPGALAVWVGMLSDFY